MKNQPWTLPIFIECLLSLSLSLLLSFPSFCVFYGLRKAVFPSFLTGEFWSLTFSFFFSSLCLAPAQHRFSGNHSGGGRLSSQFPEHHAFPPLVCLRVLFKVSSRLSGPRELLTGFKVKVSRAFPCCSIRTAPEHSLGASLGYLHKSEAELTPS